MTISLKEFLTYYESQYTDEFDAIIKWATYNGYQLELIETIFILVRELKGEKHKLAEQIREWTTHIIELAPIVTENTDLQTCLNILRIAYFAYDGYQYINTFEYILKSENINMEIIERELLICADKYKLLKQIYVDEEPKNEERPN